MACRGDSLPARTDTKPPAVWHQPVFWRGVAWWEAPGEEAHHGPGEKCWSLAVVMNVCGHGGTTQAGNQIRAQTSLPQEQTPSHSSWRKSLLHNKSKLQGNISLLEKNGFSTLFSYWVTTGLSISCALFFHTFLCAFTVSDFVTHTGPAFLLCPAGHSGGGPYDYRDVFWRQHAILRQRQRPPADFNPRYQRQHSDPPKAAILPATDPPGPGQLGVAPWLGPEHRPGSAGAVKQPSQWTHVLS